MLVPTVPWTESQGNWAAIVEAIENQLLPYLEQQKEPHRFVLAPASRAEANACVPHLFFSVAPRWVTVHLCWLLQGRVFTETDRGKIFLEAPANVWVPPTAPCFFHEIPQDISSSSDWLVCTITPFGCFVMRCRMGPKVHWEGPIYLLLHPGLPAFVEDWTEATFDAKGRLLGLLSLLARMQPTLSTLWELLPMGMAEMPSYLQQALQMLHFAYLRPIRLREVARWCHTSPTHLCRLFRKWTGMTPLGYLRRLRMSAAWQLLTHASLPPIMVAHLLGYRDWNHFREQFVREFKTHPCRVRSKFQHFMLEQFQVGEV